MNKGFVVRERGLAVVTPIVLNATDEDTDDQAISFTLVSEPLYGRLQYDSTQMYKGLRPCCFYHSVTNKFNFLTYLGLFQPF